MSIQTGITRAGLSYQFRTASRSSYDPAVLDGLGLCLEEEYEDTYIDPEVYDRARMEGEVREGRLVASVAFSPGGVPMACLCLRENAPFSGIGDLSMHVVRRPFRGKGLGTPLVRYVVALPEAGRFSAIGSHNATFHTISQRESWAGGLRPCGLLLSLYRSQGFRHSHPNVGVKLSYAVSTRAPAGVGPVPLYVPPEHRRFLAGVYAGMGVRALFPPPPAAPAAAPSLISPAQDESHNTLIAAVDRCGPDLCAQAAGLLERYGRRPLQTATFCVNALSPTAPAGCAGLEGLGFRFTGAQPFCRGAHYLLYHHPMGVDVPFGELRIDESFQNVLRYVQAQFAAPADLISGGDRP